jgi:hypothetical protein
MLAEKLLEVAEYIKGAAKLNGLLQVDTCETQQIHAVNNVLVEFHKQDREAIHYTLLIKSDTCLKTLRLHDLIKQRIEGRYRWIRSEAVVTKKKTCEVCESIRCFISVPVSAPPANYEPEILLPTIFSTSLQIGFCAIETTKKAPKLNLVAPIVAEDSCCDSVLVEFTQADIKDGQLVTEITQSSFQIVNPIGIVVQPDLVKLIGKNLYAIKLTSYLPIVGTYSIRGFI